MQVGDYIRNLVRVTFIAFWFITERVLGLACNHACVLGYQFCEPARGTCRNCEDFRDYCGVDNFHISNCSSYCNSLPKAPCQQNINTTKTGVDPWTIIYILGSICFILFAAWIIFLLHKFWNRFTKKESSDSVLSSVTSSNDTITTGTDDEKQPLNPNRAESPPEEPVLKMEVECRDDRLGQVTTANDRPDRSKLTVSGKRSETLLNLQAKED